MRTVAAVLALLLTAGCSGETSPEADRAQPVTPGHRTITLLPETVPPGTGISFIQQRIDEGTPRSQVRVVNGTDHPIHVRAVGIDWEGFPADAQPLTTIVPAQTILDLRYRLPAPDCRASAYSSTMAGVVVTTKRTIRRSMPADGRRFLERLWRTACDEQTIARAVQVRLDFTGRPDTVESGTGLEAARRGHLVLTRVGAGREQVEVTQTHGSVLFTLATPAGRELAPYRRRVRLRLDVIPGRCDEHARSQATQTNVWTIRVRIGATRRVMPLVLLVPERQLETLLAFLDRACSGITAH